MICEICHQYITNTMDAAPSGTRCQDCIDDIGEATADAISDGEGHIYVGYLLHHLAKRGFGIVKLERPIVGQKRGSDV